MAQGNRIEIVDHDGWRKEFVLEKRIIYIGSDGRNDIVLSSFRGAGVEHRHLQIITPSSPNGMVNAVNLSSGPIYLGEAGDRVLPPNSAIEVSHSETLRIGDFVLVFMLQAGREEETPETYVYEPIVQARGGTASASIGLRLSLNQSTLRVGAPLEGVITVRNQGSAPGVQFQLAVEGFPRECLEIGAAPILFPNAEKNIPLRLHHPRSPAVPAGPLRFTIRASALEAYPGESVNVAREIQVEPYYHHAVQLSEI